MERLGIEWALGYAKRRKPVFPLFHPTVKTSERNFKGGCSCGNKECKDQGKHPITSHGFKDASIDLGQIRSWWKEYPEANIGIRTGRESGWLVVDVDRPEAYYELQEEFGTFPETLTQETGRGHQMFFQYPEGEVVGSKTDFRKKIDIRGEGGYVVAPPSIHLNGKTYSWTDRSPAAPVPASLLCALLEEKSPQVIGGEEGLIKEGRRDVMLTSIGGTLRRRGVATKAISGCLLAINEHQCSPPLSTQQVNKIATSVGRYSPGSLEAHNSYEPVDIGAFVESLGT